MHRRGATFRSLGSARVHVAPAVTVPKMSTTYSGTAILLEFPWSEHWHWKSSEKLTAGMFLRDVFILCEQIQRISMYRNLLDLNLEIFLVPQAK